MPLIEIKNFPSIIEFHKHVRVIDTFDLVGTWIGSTAHQIFINRYKFRLMEQSVPNPFDQKSGIEINLLLNQYIHNVNRHVNSIGTELDFRRFVNAELGIFSKSLLLDYSVEHAEIRQQYFEFLMQHQYKLYRINNLSHQIFATSPRISEKLSTISKASLLKLQQIDGQTISLFQELDEISEVFEKSFLNETEEKMQRKQYFSFVDWDYFKYPFQLEGYPEAIEEFIRAVIAWLREEMYERKNNLYWQKTPKTYLIIEEFIEELKQAIEQPKPIVQLEKVEIVNQSVAVENYPKFIFASQKDYDFFCLLASKATTSKQLSFIFREMSEKEKPPMVVVKDKQFRDWFNEQPFEMNLEGYTATYQNSINSDRLWAYNVAKQLFFNK